jgi:hypothetical protein
VENPGIILELDVSVEGKSGMVKGEGLEFEEPV